MGLGCGRRTTSRCATSPKRDSVSTSGAPCALPALTLCCAKARSIGCTARTSSGARSTPLPETAIWIGPRIWPTCSGLQASRTQPAQNTRMCGLWLGGAGVQTHGVSSPWSAVRGSRDAAVSRGSSFWRTTRSMGWTGSHWCVHTADATSIWSDHQYTRSSHCNWYPY